MNELTLLEMMEKRKEQGQELCFDKLTRDELYELWWNENISVSQIAELFNVSKYKVNKLREQWGLTRNKLILNDLNELVIDKLPLYKDVNGNGFSLLELEKVKVNIEKTTGKKYDTFAQSLADNLHNSFIRHKFSRYYRLLIDVAKEDLMKLA